MNTAQYNANTIRSYASAMTIRPSRYTLPMEAYKVFLKEQCLIAEHQLVRGQIDACKRAIGLCNTLVPSGFRSKHKSRTMGNLNRLRAKLKRIEKQLMAGE